MSSHIPTFHNLTEWTASRTAPTWAECDCGWGSPTVPDQTQAEWVHAAHLSDVGVLTPEQVRAELDDFRNAQPSCAVRESWGRA